MRADDFGVWCVVQRADKTVERLVLHPEEFRQLFGVPITRGLALALGVDAPAPHYGERLESFRQEMDSGESWRITRDSWPTSRKDALSVIMSGAIPLLQY